MRLLDRNKKAFWYCLYNDMEQAVDEDGNYTGEQIKAYSKPIKLEGRITPNAGDSSIENFGVGIEYDKKIILEGTDYPITETTVLFVDKEPEDDVLQYDYTVSAVRPDLNYTVLAIKKVR